MFRPSLAIPLTVLALAGCAKGDTPNPAVLDFPTILAKAEQYAAEGCLVRPIAESIGPLVANAIDIAFLGGAPVAVAVEAVAHQAADTFCKVVQDAGGAKAARRGAAAGPVNYGTIEVRGKPVVILGTPLG